MPQKNNNVECDGLLKQCERKCKRQDSDGIFEIYDSLKCSKKIKISQTYELHLIFNNICKLVKMLVGHVHGMKYFDR